MADFYLRRDSDNVLIRGFNGKTPPVAPTGHTIFTETQIRAVYAESVGPIILHGVFTGSVYTPPDNNQQSRLVVAGWDAHLNFFERNIAIKTEGRVWSPATVDIALAFEAMAYRGFYLVLNATNAAFTDARKTNYANRVGGGPSDGESVFSLLKAIEDGSLSAPTDPITYANPVNAQQTSLATARTIFTGAGITGATIPANSSIANGYWIDAL